MAALTAGTVSAGLLPAGLSGVPTSLVPAGLLHNVPTAIPADIGSTIVPRHHRKKKHGGAIHTGTHVAKSSQTGVGVAQASGQFRLGCIEQHFDSTREGATCLKDYH